VPIAARTPNIIKRNADRRVRVTPLYSKVKVNHRAATIAGDDKPIIFLRERGGLPGTGPMTHRLDAAVGSLQRNWLVKLIVVAGALGSAGVAFLQVWRMLGH
jgi:hypothetical protein